MRRFPRLSSALLILAGALLCVGCGATSRNVTLPVWQKNIEQYVQQQGNGDPAVLRDVTLPDSRRGYAVIGSDRPEQSSDANGVLLGYRQINGHDWFIYLVGMLRQQNVQEIRLVALSADGGKFHWELEDKNSEATQRYAEYNDRLWRQRFPQRAAAPPQYLGFPRPDDQFEMTISNGQITVVHPPSGARWLLTIPVKPGRA